MSSKRVAFLVMLKFGKTAASSRTHDGANDHLAGGGVLPCVGAVVIWIYIKLICSSPSHLTFELVLHPRADTAVEA